MPMPQPNDGENEKDFIARCMGDETMNEEYPDTEQRAAVCHSQWDNKDDTAGSATTLGNCLGAMAGVWSILPGALDVALAIFGEGMAELRTRIRDRKHKAASTDGMVAVLPLYGVLMQRDSLSSMLLGGTSTESFGAAFDEVAANESVSAIVLDVDSPGGSVYGIAELADKIRAARKPKRPIYAIANSLMASAAYWVGSAADKLFVTPGGEMGSIGTLAIHTDVSEAEKMDGVKHTFVHAGKYKVEANRSEPLGDEARGEMQRRVDHYYRMFVNGVAANRGMTAGKIEETFGQGRLLSADQARKVGMVDRVMTYEALVGDLLERQQKRDAVRRAHAKTRGVIDRLI